MWISGLLFQVWIREIRHFSLECQLFERFQWSGFDGRTTNKMPTLICRCLQALAEALKTNTSVTEISLGRNQIGAEGAKAWCLAAPQNRWMLRHVMLSYFRHPVTVRSLDGLQQMGPQLDLILVTMTWLSYLELIWSFIIHLGSRVVQSAVLRCPLAIDSLTKTGPDGGDGGAKERSLGMSSLRPGQLWGEAMDPLFRPTWIGGVGKPGETSEVM